MTAIPAKKYQTFLPRFGAMIIDAIIFVPVVILGTMVFGPHADRSIAWILLQNILFFAYSIIGHYKFGQTIGKRVTSVKVVQCSDETKLLSLKQAFLRDSIAIALVALQIVVMALGYSETTIGELIMTISTFLWAAAEFFTMLLNSKRRSIHDLIAGSVCIGITKYQTMGMPASFKEV